MTDHDAIERTGPGPVTPAAARARWDALVESGGVVVADGAMGTMLFAAGLQFGDPPEMWNVALPQGSMVRQIHRAYLDAGAQVILTNTFGGNRLRLSLHGNERHVGEVNQMAAAIARAEVDAADHDALVAGDIGPSGSLMDPLGT
ncbi:MAG: homocysteine S-methyltransferase family protein, partial [Candidatus Limnocylindrales bacterium]